MPVVDFSNVKELEAVPAGEYAATVADIKRTDKPGKDPYYAVKFTISDDEDETVNGRTVFRNLSTSQKALFALKSFLVCSGAPDDIFSGPVDLDEVMKDTIGSEVLVVVGVKMYDDREVNEVLKIKPA